MFESLGKDGQPDTGRYLASLLISIVAHAVILGALVLLPLAFFNVLHADELIIAIVEPPSIPVAPPPPVAPTAHRQSAGPKVFKVKINEAPGSIPNGIHPETEPPETTGIETVIQGVPSLHQGEVTGYIIGEILKLKNPGVSGPPPPPTRRTPIKVSGVIQAGKLIHKVEPVYPPLAIQARVSGTVILEAMIDEEGNVTDLKILEGHPLLRDAAYNAVKQWKYLPTMIGGEPVPVVATVTLIFRFR